MNHLKRLLSPQHKGGDLAVTWGEEKIHTASHYASEQENRRKGELGTLGVAPVLLSNHGT